MERIGEEIARELARGGARDALPLSRLAAVWPELVGDAIARHAWPLRISRDGTLHIATSSATWASELTLLAEEVLARVRAHLGSEAPAALRCAVGPVPEAATPTPPSSVAPSVSDPPPEVVAAASSAASAIDDPELREIVARAARASLARGAADRRF